MVALPASMMLVSLAAAAVDFSAIGVTAGKNLGITSSQLQQTSDYITRVGDSGPLEPAKILHGIRTDSMQNQSYAEMKKVAFKENVDNSRAGPIQFRSLATSSIVAEASNIVEDQTFGNGRLLIEAETWGWS